MKRLLSLVIVVPALFSSPLLAQHPNWQSYIILPPNPSAYISDWENNPNAARYVLEYSGRSSQQVDLELTLTSDRFGQVLFGRGGPLYFESGPDVRELASPNIIRWSESERSDQFENLIGRAGRIPEGTYTVCVEALSAGRDLLSQACETFTIVYPDPPYLLEPDNTAEITTDFPTFQWTPVQVPVNFNIVYTIRVVELLPGQTAAEAIAANYVHYEMETSDFNLIYPMNGQTFENGKTYVWQVTANDQFGAPVSSNDGKSEVFVFKKGAGAGQISTPDYVNDGPGSDIDATKSTTALSANWAAVADAAGYQYAVGTTQGGTDVIGWTDNGTATSFTSSSLTLKHSQSYYVSVKAIDSNGTATSVQSSDGVTVDTSTPTSSLLITVPAGKTSAEFLNTTSFSVTWTGTDDVGPLTYTVDYKYGTDLTWTTWLSNTSQTSAVFPSNQNKGDGKYSFHCTARDAAGNQEQPKQKADDETTVDTKPPTAQVQALNASQSSTDFTVSWSGQDPDPASGIDYYDIQVRVDSGSWTDWLSKQTSTTNIYSGQAGHSYEFRCRAVDKAGNAGAFPQQADAKTTIPSSVTDSLALDAFADPKTLNFYYDDHTSKAYFTVIFKGPSQKVLKISEYRFIWYDDKGQQLKDEGFKPFLGKLDKGGSNLITGGEQDEMTLAVHEAGSFFDLELKALTKSTQLNDKNYQLDVVFRGLYVDDNNVGKALDSTPERLTIKYIDKAKPWYKLEITPSSGIITYSPSEQSNQISLKLKLQGAAQVKLTLDRLRQNWDKDGNQVSSLTEKLATPLVLQDVTSQNMTLVEISHVLTLTQDLSAQKQMLKGQKQAQYNLDLYYQGKDQDGNSVEEYIGSLNVTFLSTPQGLNFTLWPSTVDFTLNKLTNYVDFGFYLSGTATSGVTIDSLITYWHTSDNSLLETVPQALGKAVTINPGQSTSVPQKIELSQSQFNKALGGKDHVTHTLTLEVRGKDKNGIPVKATTSTPLTARLSSSFVNLTAQITPDEHTFDAANLQKYWNAQYNYSGQVDVTVDSFYTVWYDFTQQFYARRGNQSLNPITFKAPSGSASDQIEMTIDDYERTTLLNRPGAVKLTNSSQTEVDELFYLNYEFVGKDTLGRRVVATSNRVEVKLVEKLYPLEITADPSHIKTNDKSNAVKYTISSKINSPVTLQSRTTRIKKGTEIMPQPGYSSSTPGFKGTVTDEIIGLSSLDVVPANGLFEHTANIDLDTQWLLSGAKSADCVADVTFDGKDGSGKTVQGKIFVPITVGIPSQVADVGTEAGIYEIIPKVAGVKVLSGTTTVSSQGTTRILNGPVRLILYPSPFDSQKVAVDATNLAFSPKSGAQDTWTVNSGTFMGEATGIKKELFAVYKDILKIQKLSYDHSRKDRMLVDKAVASIPILEKTIFFTDLVIDQNGLNLKISEQEMSAFGLTFRVTDITQTTFSTGDLISLNVHLRLKGKPKSEEFVSTQLTIRDINDKKLVQMKAIPGSPVRLIPNTDYLNFKSFEFKDKANDDWVLSVEVTSDNLPIFSKIGPITGMVEYEKSGKIRGKLEPIKETTPGYTNDNTAITLGSWGAIDLTYLGVQFAGVQKISTVDGKPDTSWEFDTAQSFVGMAADLYMPFDGKVLGDPSSRIAIGDYNKPGIKIDFNGDVSAETISIASGKKLDLGPIFIKLTNLGITPSPFAIAISGGLGVNMGDVVSGEITIAGLKIDSDGNVTNFNDVVKGGNLSILKIVSLGINDVKYSSQPTTLPFTANKGALTAQSNVQVDDYFQLKGASLNIGSKGSGGSGGFDDLVVYTATSNKKTNFILSGAKVSIQQVVDLKMDFEYINDPTLGEYISVGGSATVLPKSKKIGATIYGKVGERGGEATWGFFLAVKGLSIPIGPVMLDEVGGGFFYRPTAGDVSKVTSLAGFKRIGMDKQYAYKTPSESGPGSFAVFLAAGLYISDKNLLYGRALMTLTHNYWALDAEVKAIKDRAQGFAYLNINWDAGYVEGKFSFSLDFILITAEESNNYFQFYAYDSSTWGVAGKLDITIYYFINTTTQFYIGSQGFLFDWTFQKSIDISIVEGGIKYEVMAWWRKDVSWGAYASAKAWGELLWGLVGGEIGIEGAFIGEPEYMLFASGWLEVEICWVTVFDGRVWIALGKNGFDGGTGENSKYDDIIEDARKTGQKMEEDMKKLADDLRRAREALYELNDKQIKSAGNALMMLMNLGGGGFGEAFIQALVINQYEQDRKPAGTYPVLDQVYNMIWDASYQKILQKSKALQQDSVAISADIQKLQSSENQVRALLTKNQELIKGKLPSIKDLGKVGNPVGQLQTKSVTVNGVNKEVVVGYAFDGSKANTLESGVKQQKSDFEAYHKQLIDMVKNYIDKMKEIDDLLYNSSTSVAGLTADYAETFGEISSYNTGFIDILNDRVFWASDKAGKIGNMKSQIENTLKNQVSKTLGGLDYDDLANGQHDSGQVSTTNLDEMIDRRNAFVEAMVKAGGASYTGTKINDSDPISLKVGLCVKTGLQMWYDIPHAAFQAMQGNIDQTRSSFQKAFQKNNDVYQARWNLFTMASDNVYNRKTRLYTLLYDLFDQLSLEAGTRKFETAQPGMLVVGMVDYQNQTPSQMMVVGQTGNVGTVITGGAAAQGNAFQQVILSGGTGMSAQSQAVSQKITPKAAWAEGWDYEKSRLYLKEMLQVPKIVQFSGKAYADINTQGYALLTLNWQADHPVGISEYSFSITDYSNPVSPADLTPASGQSQTVMAAQIPQGFLVTQTNLANQFVQQQQQQQKQTPQMQATTGWQYAGQAGSSATFNPQWQNLGGSPYSPVAWRSMAKKQGMTLPFLLSVHKSGPYEIWVRARGAGGYTIERRGTVDVYYPMEKEPGDIGDFGSATKQSSLSITDSSAPTTPYVQDAGDTTSSAKVLYAKWSAADYESGIQEYQYQVGYYSGGSFAAVTPWVSAGGQTELNIRLDKNMQPGIVYYIKVKAKNGAGAWSGEGISNGIKLSDGTPPTQPKIKSVALSDSLSAQWSPSSDPESQVLGYLFALGTSQGAEDLIKWTAVQGTGFSLTKSAFAKVLTGSLKTGDTCHFSVRAINGVGVYSSTATQAVKVK